MENASLTSDMERSITRIQSILSSDAFIDPAAASDTIREAREHVRSRI